MSTYLILLIFSLVSGSATMSDEKRLIKHLLENYEQAGVVGRPVYQSNSTVNVKFGLALIQILDFDEANQIIVGKYYLRHAWNDLLLQWRPEDFGGVSTVRVPIRNIWKPDIVLYNDAGSDPYSEALAVVSSHGDVLWIPQAILKSTCSVDLLDFPSDSQRCFLKFGSWVYNGWEVDVAFYDDQESMDLSSYINSNEWDLMDSAAHKNVKYYPCCSEPYPDVTFSITLRRLAGTLKYVLVTPSILLSLLALCIFWLPPHSAHKISLGVGIFAIFFYMLLVLVEISPPSTLPKIGFYYLWMMILMALSVCLSVAVMNIQRKTRPLPKLVKAVFIDCLARILCCYKPYPEESLEFDRDNEKQPIKMMEDEKPMPIEGGMATDVYKMRAIIQKVSKTGSENEMRAKNATEWKMVAEILDLILFLVYLVIIVCSMAIFL